MQVPSFVYGSIAPTFSAFNSDGTLDDAGQRNLIDFMIQQGGVSAFFIRSGMGQIYTYGMDDTKQLVKNVIPHTQGRAKVIVGCGGVWDRNYDNLPDPATYLAQGIELGQFVADAGADGAVYTIPECLPLAAGQSMDDFLIEYYTKICDKVKCPVFIYQAPGTRPEYSVTRKSLSVLADIPNLVGIKVSTADAYFIFDKLQAVKGKDFAYIVGNEMGFYAGVVAGSRACIGQGTSINPKMINAVVDRYLAGDVAGALDAQEDVNQMCERCPNPVAFYKRYATEHGFAVQNYARATGSNAYATMSQSMTDADYEAFKLVYESSMAKY